MRLVLIALVVAAVLRCNASVVFEERDEDMWEERDGTVLPLVSDDSTPSPPAPPWKYKGEHLHPPEAAAVIHPRGDLTSWEPSYPVSCSERAMVPCRGGYDMGNKNSIEKADGTALCCFCPTWNSPTHATGAYGPTPYATHIVVPEGVTSIPHSAFSFCKYFSEITLPSSLTSIGPRAFEESTGFKAITIPQSVTSIGESAFFRSHITAIDIPAHTTFGNSFYACFDLASVTLHEGLKTIPDGAFSDCHALKAIQIPSTVTSIGRGSFANTLALTTVNFPAGLQSIGANAFSGCKKLEVMKLNIPSETTIDDYAFNMPSGPGGHPVSCPRNVNRCNPTIGLLRSRGQGPPPPPSPAPPGNKCAPDQKHQAKFCARMKKKRRCNKSKVKKKCATTCC